MPRESVAITSAPLSPKGTVPTTCVSARTEYLSFFLFYKLIIVTFLTGGFLHAIE